MEVPAPGKPGPALGEQMERTRYAMGGWLLAAAAVRSCTRGRAPRVCGEYVEQDAGKRKWNTLPHVNIILTPNYNADSAKSSPRSARSRLPPTALAPA